MSGWTKRQVGNIELIHHSTASLVEIIIHSDELTERLVPEIHQKSIYLDYEEFDDLKKAIELTQ